MVVVAVLCVNYWYDISLNSPIKCIRLSPFIGNPSWVEYDYTVVILVERRLICSAAPLCFVGGGLVCMS